MRARDIMTTEVVILTPDTPIREIARIFRTASITGAPVVENGEVIGIVTEVDLIARHARPHYPRYLPLLDARIPLGGQHEYQEMVRRITGTTASDIMSYPVMSIEPDADLEEVATLMVENKANPVPVLEGGRLVGVITHSDILRTFEDVEG